MKIFINGKKAEAEIDCTHPGHCWVIRDESDSATWTNLSGMAPAFLTKEEAERFITGQKFAEKAVAKRFLWENLPRVLGRYFHAVIVENEKMPGSYRILPLNANKQR